MEDAPRARAHSPAPKRPLGSTRSPLGKATAKWMFHSHLWLGIVTTGIVLLVSITGVLLNHKRSLGLMPDVPNRLSGAFTEALPLADLARHAEVAVGPEVATSGIERMDVRPDKGLVKVRFDDPRVMEVTLDINTGEVLHSGERKDVFLEKLHSGEIFGDGWVLLSDAAAVGLGILLISGYWLWLYPRSRH